MELLNYKAMAKHLQEVQNGRQNSKREKSILEEAVRKDYALSAVLCEKCPNPADTVDHIVPDFLLAQFGVDIERHFDIENLQPMCRRCNTYNANRLDFTNPKTKQILTKYVDLIP